MPMYRVHFYRADDTEPFHSWAPFGSIDDHDAEAVVRINLTRNAAVNGTLTPTARFTLQEVTPPGARLAPIIEKEV